MGQVTWQVRFKENRGEESTLDWEGTKEETARKRANVHWSRGCYEVTLVTITTQVVATKRRP